MQRLDLYGTDKTVDITEPELLEAIRKVLSGAGPEVRVGVGDDAAVVAPGSGELVLTTDVMVEGTHFRGGLTTARDLGAKAMTISLSDVAAMAASPRYALCALTLSDRVDAAWVMELFGGMREACDEHALWLVGGNLTRGSDLTIAITVVGEVAPGRALLRSGATPGDEIVVTGSLGGAAAGRRLVEGAEHRGLGAAERDAVHRFMRPTARIGEAAVLAREGARSMIDVSDGLTLDLSRLCEAGGLGARIDAALLPVHEAATLEDALGGGEDYEVLATIADGSNASTEMRRTFGVELSPIGVITEARGLVLVDPAGNERALDPAGWDPFA
ncbi:MAG TPA: thiamine-phosphate kinase [Actinomycetota bacterium]|nr:thiamine-phosphate kinase [Actinomycetota bacterium]